MTALSDNATPPLSGAAIFARLLGVDESTARLALAQAGSIQRPVGLQLIAGLTMQDTRQTLGISVHPSVTLSTYLHAR